MLNRAQQKLFLDLKNKTSSAPPMSCECDCMSATRNNIPFMTSKLKPTGTHTHSDQSMAEWLYQAERAASRALTLNLCPNGVSCTNQSIQMKIYHYFVTNLMSLYVNRQMNECQSNFAVDVLSTVSVQAKTLIKHFQLYYCKLSSNHWHYSLAFVVN